MASHGHEPTPLPHPTSRPTPATGRQRSPHPLLAPSLLVSCEGCPVRGHACGDCLITTLWAQPMPTEGSVDAAEEIPLDADEARAVDLLVRARLVSPVDGARAVARLDGGSARAAVG